MVIDTCCGWCSSQFLCFPVLRRLVCIFFFFNDTATTEIYTLSLPRRSSDLSSGINAEYGGFKHYQTTTQQYQTIKHTNNIHTMSSEQPKDFGEKDPSKKEGKDEIPPGDNPGLPFLVGGIPLHGVDKPPVPIYLQNYKPDQQPPNLGNQGNPFPK
eukprot:TRINITY_DN4731_c0_g2_i4.p1 TRINITY_DN4731_c0_g2~~TRINITY_DN4731_c0_g2_i4.p1  ORF type:complete len:156 (-),score=35.07 TRINITY_DN4731_c0_g2_i4:188-655(-)